MIVPDAPSLPESESAPSEGEEASSYDESEDTSGNSSSQDALAAEVAAASLGNLVEIKEKLFIAQTNDIYLNPEDYVGKIIKYEGIYNTNTWTETGQTYHYVIRYGPGCCSYDANAGFEVTWNNAYPQPNDWVEAVGVLEMYEENGWQYLRLQLLSLKVLEVRGAESVTT